MCGRYVQVSSPELLAERFQVDEIALADTPEADYNVAPRKQVLTVVQRSPERRVLERMRWGLVPSWAKDPKIGDRLINARAESVAEKPAFKRAFRRHRCLLPADGFYEWQVVPGRKQKQPMFVHRRDGEPLAFAGLWEAWRDPDDADAPWICTCVIVTTRANAVIAPVHDRMPVLLEASAWDTWLDPTNEDVDGLRELLAPASDATIEMWPVATLVNRARNNGPELVARVEAETLF
ncbi:MAG: SOS response-associated peptidase [Actinobacteria bacterium]|nr:SOS response-associated peptidase [Actinomycetota bacterium]